MLKRYNTLKLNNEQKTQKKKEFHDTTYDHLSTSVALYLSW